MRPKYYKHITDLTETDFDAFPVWVCAYNTDIDEDWFDEDPADEATYMPWRGPLPYQTGAAHGFIKELAKCSFNLNDGSTLTGFASPLVGKEKFRDLGYLQPYVFIDGDRSSSAVGFWAGASTKMLESKRTRFYETLRQASEHVFPITWHINETLFGKGFTGSIAGFGHLLPPDFRQSVIEP